MNQRSDAELLKAELLKSELLKLFFRAALGHKVPAVIAEISLGEEFKHPPVITVFERPA